MNDKKLHREAMLKNYALSALLKNAANKEDVERQAVNIEKVSHPDAANRWMDERCFRPLLCTVKAELGRGQPGLMR